jgi:hypothetical protein
VILQYVACRKCRCCTVFDSVVLTLMLCCVALCWTGAVVRAQLLLLMLQCCASHLLAAVVQWREVRAVLPDNIFFQDSTGCCSCS